MRKVHSILFELEQELLNYSRVTEDIRVLSDQGAAAEEFNAIATLYERRFEKLWGIFEKINPALWDEQNGKKADDEAS